MFQYKMEHTKPVFKGKILNYFCVSLLSTWDAYIDLDAFWRQTDQWGKGGGVERGRGKFLFCLGRESSKKTCPFKPGLQFSKLCKTKNKTAQLTAWWISALFPMNGEDAILIIIQCSSWMTRQIQIKYIILAYVSLFNENRYAFSVELILTRTESFVIN